MNLILGREALHWVYRSVYPALDAGSPTRPTERCQSFGRGGPTFFRKSQIFIWDFFFVYQIYGPRICGWAAEKNC